MTTEPSHSQIRVAARLANGFAMNLVRLGGFGRDIVDGLLVAAITQANVAPINRNRDLQLAYATAACPPPDELRRPISISAVSNGLGIPFETARRRIGALAEHGFVSLSRKGAVVPTAPLKGEIYITGAGANYHLVRELYLQLRRLGVLETPGRPMNLFAPDDPPVRLVSRLSADYALRIAEPILAQTGDPVTGLILMDLVQANTEHIDPEEAARSDASAFLDDSLRKPARTSHLAARLGIPHETVRRHLMRLVADDRCERREDGYVVTARILGRDAFQRFMLDNMSHLHRLYAALGEYGLPAEWEAAAGRADPA